MCVCHLEVIFFIGDLLRAIFDRVWTRDLKRAGLLKPILESDS